MIDGIPILDIGQSGLIALVVIFVLTDRLVWYKRLQKLEEIIEARDAHIASLTTQNELLLKSAIPTVNGVLTALHKAAELDGP